MLPQAPPRKASNSAKVNLLISLGFHGAIVIALVFFAAREGLLGKQLKKITIQMVKETTPPKPKEPEKPKAEPPKVEPPKLAPPKIETVRTEPPKGNVAAPPPSLAAPPPAFAPPTAEVPSFVFDGGKTVQSSSDPVELYRGSLESKLRAHWNRPANVADDDYIVEVEISVDHDGHISNPEWKKSSGDTRWDSSVRQAIALTGGLDRSPPPQFPSRVLVRFDVQDATEPILQNQ